MKNIPIIKDAATSIVIAGVVTGQVVTNDTPLTGKGTRGLSLVFEVSGVTVVGTLTARIQQASPNGSFANLGSANSTVSITGNGSFRINLIDTRSADAADMPLMPRIRGTLTTTNAGDRITIDKIYLQQDV